MSKTMKRKRVMPSKTKKKKAAIPTMEYVHFHVQGERICELVRDLFQREGEERKAFNILMKGVQGMTSEIALQICIGAKELRGWDSNLELVDLDGNASFETVIDRIVQLRGTLADRVDELSAVYDPEAISSPWGLVEVSRSFAKKLKTGEASWEDCPYEPKRLPHYPDRFPRIKKEREDREEEEEEEKTDSVFMLDTDAILPENTDPRVRKMIQDKANAMLGPAKKPEEDKELKALNGWLDPEGRLWPCAYGCHVESAADLGSDEHKLEKEGWIKIQNHEEGVSTFLTADVIVEDESKPVTQSQFDAVWEWCQKHKRPFPKWLKTE